MKKSIGIMLAVIMALGNLVTVTTAECALPASVDSKNHQKTE